MFFDFFGRHLNRILGFSVLRFLSQKPQLSDAEDAVLTQFAQLVTPSLYLFSLHLKSLLKKVRDGPENRSLSRLAGSKQ